MIAVCGIGRPSGRLNSATTAYQSARPPMVAASANAATKPKAGCTGNSAFAAMNTASVAASTDVAKSFTRRNSAARAASPGASNENVAETVMTAFEANDDPHPQERRPRRVSKDEGPIVASWFETAQGRLLTMRVWLIYERTRQKE